MAQTREEWEQVKQYAEPVFVDIDRPEVDDLVVMRIEINGDSSCGIDIDWAERLSLAQMRALIHHAAELLKEEESRYGEDGFNAEFLRRAAERSDGNSNGAV